MIKYTAYQLTKDRKIGIEVKAWNEGYITVIIECRQDNGMMLRSYRCFTKLRCKDLTEELFLRGIVESIKLIRPHAKQVVGNVTVVH